MTVTTIDETGRCFGNVNCRLPYDLKTAAKANGIRFSRILENAVRAELEKLGVKE